MDVISREIDELISYMENNYDHVLSQRVPCKPLTELPGLAFLSPKAIEEQNVGIRSDVLLPHDQLELPLYFGLHLMSKGLCKISFPQIYNNATSLLAEPTASAVGLLSPLYFELGTILCQQLPESDWPVENLAELLKNAECARRSYLLKRQTRIDDTFLKGLTHKEKMVYNSVLHNDFQAQNHTNRNVDLYS